MTLIDGLSVQSHRHGMIKLIWQSAGKEKFTVRLMKVDQTSLDYQGIAFDSKHISCHNLSNGIFLFSSIQYQSDYSFIYKIWLNMGKSIKGYLR